MMETDAATSQRMLNPLRSAMRIAFLVYAFPRLSETFILNQITGLIDAGHEVDIYASGAEDVAKVHADIERYALLERTCYVDIPRGQLRRVIEALGRVKSSQGWRRPGVLVGALNVRAHGRLASSLTLLYRSIEFLGRRPYDIVHSQFGTLARTALALQDIGAVSGKLVVSFRGSDMPAKGRIPDYREVFRKGHLFLPVCTSFKEQLIEQGCNGRKIRVHHSGIKLSRFAYTERRRGTNEPTRVLTVARLIDKKGLAYAIRAIARVKASGRQVRYTVVGHGPLRGELERLIDTLDLGAEVHLVGARDQDEVITLLQDAHLFVTPSVTAASGDREGIPNVLKEAMATGIPVIGTRHSAIPELVEDGVSGLLVPEGDVEALTGRLIDLIDHPERWPEMGRAGRERVEAEFDSDKLNDQLIALYEQIVAGNLT
jgi:colanic acid/amylovoran biosynthesis glycosyltransferase